MVVGRSWRLVWACWRVGRRDPIIRKITFLLIVSITVFGALLVVRYNPGGRFDSGLPVVGAFPGTGGAGGANLRLDPFTLGWFVSLVVWAASGFSANLGFAAITATIFARIAEQPVTMNSVGIQVRSKTRPLLGFTLIALAFGQLTAAIGNSLGSPADRIDDPLTSIWLLATQLVIPVIMAESITPMQALSRSAHLVWENKGLMITGNILLLMIGLTLIFALVLISIFPVYLIVESGAGFATAFALILAVVGMTGVVLSAIYSAVIYSVATNPGKNQPDPAGLLLGAYGFSRKRKLNSANPVLVSHGAAAGAGPTVSPGAHTPRPRPRRRR